MTQPVDMLAVWECFQDYPDLLDKLPTEGAWSHRQFVCDHLTGFCDTWFQYLSSFFGYDYAYDWEFLPYFLQALPTLDIDELSLSDIGLALQSPLTDFKE